MVVVSPLSRSLNQVHRDAHQWSLGDLVGSGPMVVGGSPPTDDG